MNAQQFLAEFGHIANAPGGVEKLRLLVLQLAVQGKLLGQTELRRRYLLGNVGKWGSGGTPAKTHSEYYGSDIPWLVIGDLNDGLVTSASSSITPKGLENSAAKLVPPGTLFIGMYGSIGKLGIAGMACATNQAIAHCIADETIVLTSYLFILIRANRDHLFSQGKGLAQQNISQTILKAQEIDLPLVKEQRHIVAKVDELMALCDQLEKQQQDRRKLQNALRQSTLQAVASAQSPHELRTSWERLQANFGQLFSEPEDVDDVIAGLKNLAVRGVLVEASRSVPDLARVTEDCSALRSEYIAKGLMRRQKLVGMAESDLIYPEPWVVAAFDEIAVVIGGVTKGRDLRGKQVVVCPYLAVANVQRGYFKLEGLKSIEIAEDELPKYLVHDGDLLITEGGDWDKVGRTAIWRGSVDNCLHQNHVFKARVPSKQLLKEWVALVFNSGIGRDYFAGASKQTTNLASINMTQLRSFPLPIPPVEEQQRILDGLATLTDLCEEWRRQLKHKHDLVSMFAAASVSAFTGINIEQDEDTAVKAPQTELIALLRLAVPPDVKAQAPLATILARHQGEMAARDLWQRFGGEIDAFYAQLKTEVAHGWIAEPEVAQVREKPTAQPAKA
jgi:type I restriction enzyme, S subunit